MSMAKDVLMVGKIHKIFSGRAFLSAFCSSLFIAILALIIML